MAITSSGVSHKHYCRTPTPLLLQGNTSTAVFQSRVSWIKLLEKGMTNGFPNG